HPSTQPGAYSDSGTGQIRKHFQVRHDHNVPSLHLADQRSTGFAEDGVVSPRRWFVGKYVAPKGFAEMLAAEGEQVCLLLLLFRVLEGVAVNHSLHNDILSPSATRKCCKSRLQRSRRRLRE